MAFRATETQWPNGQGIATEVMTDVVQQSMEAQVLPWVARTTTPEENLNVFKDINSARCVSIGLFGTCFSCGAHYNLEVLMFSLEF